MTESFLRDLLIRTLRDPRGAAAQILAMGLPMQARWLALGAVIALSALLGTLAEIMFSFVTKIDLGPSSPVPMALAQGALLLYGAFAMSFVGRWFGGQGRFADALLLLVWMEFVLILGQVVQVLMMVFFPLSAVVASALLLGMMFWLLVQFTAALHGFERLSTVSAGVIVTFFASALVSGVILLSLGIVPVPAAG
ncbi:MAG: YIP1 family protein [Paracoccaceae bacterium]|jgi:hypothetical protein|nr:YIP1 family protein [Paracoccaceae bacterium]